MQIRDIVANGAGLHAVLNLPRLTEIVDVGANPIDGDPPYKTMLESGICRLTGFEPQKEALERLLQSRGNNETYLPYAVGDGKRHMLRLYHNVGLVSLFELDPATIEIFQHFKPGIGLRGEEEIETKRLDDLHEIPILDFLKIDIQGGELEVFRSGKRKLANAVAIQTEVTFFPLYKNQPCIGDIDIELRSQGFIPHCFAMPHRTAPIAPLTFDNHPWKGLNQLGEADLVYVRDFRKPDDMTSEMLKHLALIASCCYGSVDLAYRCMMLLADRGGEIEADACERYLNAKLPMA